MPRAFFQSAALVLLALFGTAAAHAGERITLTSGFTVDCLRHETSGTRLRLILASSDPANPAANYMDVPAASVATIDAIPDPPATPHLATAAAAPAAASSISAAALHPLLAHAGEAHRIDEDLLASIVRAESGGNPHAVSRTGARGLMQLMPATAAHLGVHDAFAPSDNINGGTAYLDSLLTRYHDNLALAVAAYNAGPGAVDRFGGIPPYRETRAYVARVIREFNRRKLAAAAANTALRAGLR